MNLALLPYLKGCALLQPDQKQAHQNPEMLLLLDAGEILRAPVMQGSIQDSFMPV